MRAKYPNLEYLEKQFLGNIIKEHPEFIGRIQHYDVTAEMFAQNWPSTAGGFCEPGMLAGQMITTEYTTVMTAQIFYLDEDKTQHEYIMYAVFFGNKGAYMVNDPPEVFFEDLKMRQMKSRYEAGKVY